VRCVLQLPHLCTGTLVITEHHGNLQWYFAVVLWCFARSYKSRVTPPTDSADVCAHCYKNLHAHIYKARPRRSRSCWTPWTNSSPGCRRRCTFLLGIPSVEALLAGVHGLLRPQPAPPRPRPAPPAPPTRTALPPRREEGRDMVEPHLCDCVGRRGGGLERPEEIARRGRRGTASFPGDFRGSGVRNEPRYRWNSGAGAGNSGRIPGPNSTPSKRQNSGVNSAIPISWPNSVHPN
jgi:hypothetical protein